MYISSEQAAGLIMRSGLVYEIPRAQWRGGLIVYHGLIVSSGLVYESTIYKPVQEL